MTLNLAHDVQQVLLVLVNPLVHTVEQSRVQYIGDGQAHRSGRAGGSMVGKSQSSVTLGTP
jgi:hypothetical protein